MSVIIISPDGFRSVRRLVESLRAQTARARLELVFVFSAGTPLAEDALEPRGFAAVRIVETGAFSSTAQARAAGILAATSPVVVLTEDHSLPEPEWAEALIRSHRGEAAAIGPVVSNGNPDSLLSWANFLIEYNEWLDPAPSGPVNHLPGHNSSYKRDILTGYGSEMAVWLEAESLLHWDLRSRGYRLQLEPEARTRHFNFSRGAPSMVLRFHAGRLFAGMRSRTWNAAKHLAYGIAAPLIPVVRLRRILRELRRPGRSTPAVFRLLPWFLVLLACDALGEMAGYLSGPGTAALQLVKADFHRAKFMNALDRAKFSDLES